MNNKYIIIVVVLLLLVSGYYFISSNKTDKSKDDAMVEKVDEKMEPKDSMVDEPKGTLEGEEMMEEEDDAMVEDDAVVEEDAMMEESEVKTFEVGGGSFYFDSDEITVTEGDTVKIVFTNEGGTHDWVIDQFNARTPITQTGDIEEIEFVADEAGSFEYYCSVGNHRAEGMVGTLIVEPAL